MPKLVLLEYKFEVIYKLLIVPIFVYKFEKVAFVHKIDVPVTFIT